MADASRIDDLRRRVQADPASLAFAQLAEELRRAGQLDEAIRVSHSGLGHHPEYLSARVTLGRALLATGQLDQAQAELSHVLQAAPENLAALRGLAEIHQRRGQADEALAQYRRALALAPHDAELADLVAAGQSGRPRDGAAPLAPVPAAQVAALERWLRVIVADRQFTSTVARASGEPTQ